MRAVVVGAGLSGLACARSLTASGHEVTVLDKGRSPGGRLATRRLEGAVLDHGAQFFTVRDEAFADEVASLVALGLVTTWCNGFAAADGHPRYVVRGGMNALAKHLATGLDVRCGHLAFGVHPGSSGGWSVAIDDGSAIAADAVVLTCPIPQTMSLCVTAGVDVPRELWGIEYDRTLALLAVLGGPSAVAPPGGRQHPDEVFSFVGDNRAKGVSSVPALTLHANPDWSLAHWDDEPAVLESALRAAAAPYVGDSPVLAAQVKRWRFATPQTTWPDPFWRADSTAPLVFAGDAFAGPRVEGAYSSGLAAAAAVLV
jgi:predicted NAD/FAD-dependent oxidoreductase